MRLIDADELKKQAYKSSDWSHGEHPYVVEVYDIDEAPTIDAEPVRHGHWISDATGDCCYRCDECQFLRDAYSLDVGNYCPNYGAKMDG